MIISDLEIEKMYKWIQQSMKTDVWYPVKSDEAYESLKQLFEEELIENCEFDEQETHIRKVQLFNINNE